MPPKNFNGWTDAWGKIMSGETKVTGSPTYQTTRSQVIEAGVPAVAVARSIAPYVLPVVAATSNYISSPESFAQIPHDFSNWLGNTKYGLMNMYYNTLGYRPQARPVTAEAYNSYARPVESVDAIKTPQVMIWGRNTLPKGFKKRGDVVVLPGGERVDSKDVTQKGDTTIVKGKGLWDKRGVRIEDTPQQEPSVESSRNQSNNSQSAKGGSNEDPDKKPFWKTGWGKAAKWGIGLGAETGLMFGIDTAVNANTEDETPSTYPMTQGFTLPGWIYTGITEGAKAKDRNYKEKKAKEQSNTATVKKEEPKKVETPVQENRVDSLTPLQILERYKQENK